MMCFLAFQWQSFFMHGGAMSELSSFRSPVPNSFAAVQGKYADFTALAPKLNHLLAALPEAEYARLASHLEPVSWPAGRTVHAACDRQKYVYFPISGIVSQFYMMQDGACSEFALTGNEGAIGVASFLGGESAPSGTMALIAGQAFRLRADLLQDEFERGGALALLLLRYTLALITQIGQIAVCNRHHSLEQRLCRWILSVLDRSPSNQLAMTHEVMADALGVRREAVTLSAGRLQLAGLIQYSRGHLTVLDRHRLVARVCECYAVVRREYDRLLPECRQTAAQPIAQPNPIAPRPRLAMA